MSDCTLCTSYTVGSDVAVWRMAVYKVITLERFPVDGSVVAINTKDLGVLVSAGVIIDMYLQYEDDGTSDYGHYLIYVKYNRTLIRQIYTFQHRPRVFKDIARALAFGKEYGLRSVSMEISLDDYKTKLLSE